MSLRLEDSRKHRLLGVVAVLLLGLGHGTHDWVEGRSAVSAFVPSLTMALQVAALSWGERVARKRGWSPVLAFAGASLLSLAFGASTIALHGDPPRPFVLEAIATATASFGVLAFWFLIFYLPAQLSEARARALRAESGQREAELARLRSNLQPHFLLNTLNGVAGLVTAEPRQARQLVVLLGELLRDSLEDGGAMLTLADEVDWLRRYAGIFEIRHRGSVCFEWDLAPETLPIPVPRLLLQPLLENAIQHGALRRPGGGKVSVTSRRDGSITEIVVSDDGPGLDSARGHGLGLRLVEDRLHLAYPSARMQIDSSAAGTRVVLSLPELENGTKTKTKTKRQKQIL